MSADGDTDLVRNVLYVLDRHPRFRGASRDGVGKTLGVNPSTRSRWYGLKSVPSERAVRSLARHAGIDQDLLHKKHSDFVQILSGMERNIDTDYKRYRTTIDTYATDKWRHLWNECFKRHKGSYILYCRIPTTKGGEDQATVALLNVVRLTERGILYEIFDLDDRFRRASGKIGYCYAGLMLPVRDALFFVGDEESGDEPMAMITTSSQKRPPALLTGYIVAIGVNAEQHLPMARKVALAFYKDALLSEDEAKDLLGIVPISKVPEPIQAHI